MTPNPFDQACRYTAKLNPVGFLVWLLPRMSVTMRFRQWLDTRTIPFPGQPDRTGDTVAGLVDDADPEPWWAIPIEFQGAPDHKMFGRLLQYVGRFWCELRPPGRTAAQFQVAACVVNLTGRGKTSRDMKLGRTGLRTTLKVRECDLETIGASATLSAIAEGRIARCILPFVPLMRGGGKRSIMVRWRELAEAEPDERLRSDYGGLALVFAELAGNRAEWRTALEGFDVKQSMQVLEWQHEATVETRINDTLRILEKRFGLAVPSDVAEKVRSTTDLAILDRWFDEAITIPSLDEFRRLVRP